MMRILTLLDQKENQELLSRELTRSYEVVPGASDADLEQPFDLCVLDDRSLGRLRDRVRQRKEREQPIFLPVLLVTARPGVKLITRHLWRSVDELIVTPIEKAELSARVEILLRARDLSLVCRERAQAAEDAARTRDDVMAIVAHDLRNPLNLVLANASMLLEFGAPLEPAQREQIELIHRSVGRMNRLVQDLLDVSALEAGHLPVHPGEFPVEPLLRAVCAQHEGAAHARRIRLVCEPDGQLPPVRADRDRLDQVLANLIDNALKYTPEGGIVRVRAEPDERDVIFSVADTGPGIAYADQPHIFDRFWQASQARKGGAGLGLAIARGIVVGHGGRIWVESRPGEGSTFRFTLPAATTEPTEPVDS